MNYERNCNVGTIQLLCKMLKRFYKLCRDLFFLQNQIVFEDVTKQFLYSKLNDLEKKTPACNLKRKSCAKKSSFYH